MKREGDGRSPAGVFAIGEAFGYAATATTALPYAPMQASDYCVDVSGSPLYNRIVDANVVGADAIKGATEPMRRDLHADGDQRYRLGFVIEHNPRQVAMGGSCIFAHLWKSPSDPTTGCTAMDSATMDALVGWLRPDRNPVFVLLPLPAYTTLRAAWALPRDRRSLDQAVTRVHAEASRRNTSVPASRTAACPAASASHPPRSASAPAGSC